MNTTMKMLLAGVWVVASCALAAAQQAETVRLRGTIAKADGHTLMLKASDGAEHKLLEPFQTGNTAGGGAGLGLSIVREIMTAHGGELAIFSAPGHGTTMSLRFPERAAATKSPQLDLEAR